MCRFESRHMGFHSRCGHKKYKVKTRVFLWSRRLDSNQRHLGPKLCAFTFYLSYMSHKQRNHVVFSYGLITFVALLAGVIL